MNQSSGESACPYCGSASEGYDDEAIMSTFVCGSGYSVGGPWQSAECVLLSAEARAARRPSVDELLDTLRGDRERLRNLLLDKDHLLEKLCQYAEITGKRKRAPPWSIVGQILGHGSGVASAIYELYRRRPVRSSEGSESDG